MKYLPQYPNQNIPRVSNCFKEKENKNVRLGLNKQKKILSPMKYLSQCPNRSVPRVLNCSLKKKKK